MISFYDTCHNVHVDVMRAIALGLGLGVSYFDSLINESWHTLRLLNYPSVERQILERDGGARANAHTGKIHQGSTLYCTNSLSLY